MLHVLQLIEEMGPDLGLSINLAKCELFSPTIKSSFPPVVKSSCLDILGAPIGDYLFCAHLIAERCGQAKKLLFVLLVMADSDLHVSNLIASNLWRFLQAIPHFENHSPCF